MTWTLHSTLAADTHQLGVIDSWVHLLLHKSAAQVWFLLVPERDCLDLFDLEQKDQYAINEIATELHQFMKSTLDYERVNVGALGLVVPQLHLHLVGRNRNDAHWPKPIWGQTLSDSSYTDTALTAILHQLRERFTTRFR